MLLHQISFRNTDEHNVRMKSSGWFGQTCVALDLGASRKKHAKIVSGNFLFNDETNIHTQNIHDRGYTGERTTVDSTGPESV